MSRAAAILALFFALLASPHATSAHPPVPTVALVRVTSDNTITITVIHDALAFALNDTSERIGDDAMFDLLNASDEEIEAACSDGVARFNIGFRLAADAAPVAFDLTEAPSTTSLRAWISDNPDRRLPCTMDMVARASFPAGASRFTLRFPEIFASVLLILDRHEMEPVELPLVPGETSPSFALPPAPAIGGTIPSTAQEPESINLPWRFAKLGFTHILPGGPDHCLFVLGLFLLSPKLKSLLWQISAFTIAHTVTLTLTTLHIIGLPASIVEPAIALSVAFIGVENLLTNRIHPWRLAVAFLFGLVHGMGVATAFSDAGVSSASLVFSLAAFTVGVEAGHLAVLALAFLCLGWARDKPWYRHRVTIPISVLISVTALVWITQRL